jgi:hypothetical protein
MLCWCALGREAYSGCILLRNHHHIECLYSLHLMLAPSLHPERQQKESRFLAHSSTLWQLATTSMLIFFSHCSLLNKPHFFLSLSHYLCFLVEATKLNLITIFKHGLTKVSTFTISFFETNCFWEFEFHFYRKQFLNKFYLFQRIIAHYNLPIYIDVPSCIQLTHIIAVK